MAITRTILAIVETYQYLARYADNILPPELGRGAELGTAVALKSCPHFNAAGILSLSGTTATTGDLLQL